jgi:hypothetical protein
VLLTSSEVDVKEVATPAKLVDSLFDLRFCFGVPIVGDSQGSHSSTGAGTLCDKIIAR